MGGNPLQRKSDAHDALQCFSGCGSLFASAAFSICQDNMGVGICIVALVIAAGIRAST